MKTRTRKATVIATSAGLLLAIGGATPALAASGGAPPGAVQARQMDVVQQVTAFWDQYKSAVLGTNPDMNPREVRGEFITAEANAELDAWAELNGADPIFRAQNVPVDRTVRYEGSGMGHASVVVTQYWGNGATYDVWYSVRLDNRRIDEIKDPPIAPH